MVFKMDVKPNFTVENEAAIKSAPKVDFDKPAAAPAASAAPNAEAKGAPVNPAGDSQKKGN